jgi:hypothetical protein
MFENKAGDQSNSPPSRGRSPSGSINSGSSRQVSKVRASFVAVERPGDISSAPQWGLRKASDVSSMAEVKENHTADDLTRTQTVESQAMSPTSPHTSKDSIDGGIGTILKGSSFEGTPRKPSAPAEPQKTEKVESTPNGVGSRAAEMIKKMQSNEKPAPPPTTKVVTNPDAKPIKNPHPKPLVKPSPDSPRVPRLEKASPKTPTDKSAAKTPTSPANAKPPLASIIRGGPAKVKGVMESAKRASDAREAAKKEPPKPLQTKPTTNGVKKESVTSPAVTSPRSPTKFAKLPSAVTATTAAAAAKHETQPTVQPPAKRTAPRASMPAMQSRATAATTASSLHKKTSRASLAPNGAERPKSRASTSGKPDSGFLERMMRPTQSSAQKSHEKVQVSSPPRPKAVSSRPKVSRKSDQSDIQTGTVDEEPTTLSPAAEATHGEPASAASAEVETHAVPEQTEPQAISSEQPTATDLNGSSASPVQA